MYAADVSNRKGEQSRQLLELRQRRDIRQVAPRRTELYNDYDDVHHSRLVNRLQDKASNTVIISLSYGHTTGGIMHLAFPFVRLSRKSSKKRKKSKKNLSCQQCKQGLNFSSKDQRSRSNVKVTEVKKSNRRLVW